MKNKYYINDIDKNKSYEMRFQSGNDDQDNSNSDNNSPRRGMKKGTLSTIIIAIIFIGLIASMIYFFAFRNTDNTIVYSESDITYRIDNDKDGNPDDISTYDDTKHESLNEVVMKDSEGELAYILLNPSISKSDASPYKNVTMNVTLSNVTSQMVYVSGKFGYYNSETGKIKKYSYKVNLTQDNYKKYIDPIIKYTKINVLDDQGNNHLVTYYSYQNGTLSPLTVEQSSNVMSWLIPLLGSLLVVGVMIFFMTRMSRGGENGANPMSGFVDNVARKSSGSKIRFTDVAGCDEAKAELVEMVDYFHSTDKYTRLGAKLPHGVLLVGPPGTGKTLLAKAVAGEANVPFFSISGSDFVEMYVGVGASRVRSLFKTAKKQAPCLIFIDEIDAVGRQRGAGLGGGNDEREQTLNELLVEMDGFDDNNGIIVIAATNRSDVLDPALTRPGRFDRTITVDLPDKEGRAAILAVHSRNKKIAADINFESIAGRTTGFSGADLANIMNDAAILAVRNNRSAITTADIDEAIDRAVAGPAKRSHLELNEKRQVAYHESGHAVIGLFLPYSDKVQKITIIPRGRTGGFVLMTPEQDRFLNTKNQLLAKITGYLGGRTSEEIFFGDVSTGASNDIEMATNIARGMVTEYGMSDLGPIQYEKASGSVFLGRDYNSAQANYSTQVAFQIDEEVRKIIESCHEKAREILLQHKDDVELLANTLIEREQITADQIEYLLKNREMPKVDEHKIDGDGTNCKNPYSVVLYPELANHYRKLDAIIDKKPSRLVVIVSNDSGLPITQEQFVTACKNGARDVSNIGLYFVDRETSMQIKLSVESFASHIEQYTGIDVILIKTDDESFKVLQNRYSPNRSEESRRGVVKEILPSDKKEEEQVKPEDSHSDEDSQE